MYAKDTSVESIIPSKSHSFGEVVLGTVTDGGLPGSITFGREVTSIPRVIGREGNE